MINVSDSKGGRKRASADVARAILPKIGAQIRRGERAGDINHAEAADGEVCADAQRRAKQSAPLGEGGRREASRRRR